MERQHASDARGEGVQTAPSPPSSLRTASDDADEDVVVDDEDEDVEETPAFESSQSASAV